MYVKALADGDGSMSQFTSSGQQNPTRMRPHRPSSCARSCSALEQGLWSVNTVGVPVLPGLVVSFREARDAAWFLNQSLRASRVEVKPGEIVVFHNDEDAQHFIEQGLAERVHRKEAQALLAESKPDNVLQIEKGARRAAN